MCVNQNRKIFHFKEYLYLWFHFHINLGLFLVTVKTENGALNLAQIIELVKDNKENQLKGILHSSSFPVTVHLKGINDSNPLLLNKRYPFKIIPRKLKLETKNEKIEDNFVETHTSNKVYF